MSNRRHPLLQELKINGQFISPEHIVSFTYIESMNLTSPAIILKLRDEPNIIRDSGVLVAEADIVCEIADHANLDSDSFIETFTLSAFPIRNGIITIEALNKQCHDLKKLSAKPWFFVDKKPYDIIHALLPELKIDCRVNRRKGTYHLNVGMTKARLLKQLARDYGCAIWIARGTVYFVPIEELGKQRANLVYALGRYDNADAIIQDHKVLNNNPHYERTLRKHYITTSPQKGLVIADEHQDYPSVLLPQMEKWQLNNQSKFIQPRLEVIVIGNGNIKPSIPINVEIHKFSVEGGIDESIEPVMLVEQVSHHQQNKDYIMRVHLGVAHD